jgi:hypothetical protein
MQSLLQKYRTGFRRARGMLAIPDPVAGGSLAKLHDFTKGLANLPVSQNVFASSSVFLYACISTRTHRRLSCPAHRDAPYKVASGYGQVGRTAAGAFSPR